MEIPKETLKHFAYKYIAFDLEPPGSIHWVSFVPKVVCVNFYLSLWASMAVCMITSFTQHTVLMLLPQTLIPPLRLAPDHAVSHNNLGTLLEQEEAEHHFREAVRYNPQHYRAFFNLGSNLRQVFLLAPEASLLSNLIFPSRW